MTESEHRTAFPERIGRYELFLPIGSGGMGNVYLGRVEVTKDFYRDVAVKLMHAQLRSDPEVAEELLREAKLAGRIVHPNVVRVHEAGDSAHGVFMAMDYVEGTTLSGLLRRVNREGELMPLAIAGRILCDALAGLHAAHCLKDDAGQPLGIIHRDFSPQNILVGTDGISRLADFGIAKAIGEAGGTATGIVKGKIGYMSPEQARGNPIDARTDLWAAGVVAWETLTGTRLFRGPNDAATLLMIVSDSKAPLVSSRRSDVTAAMDAAIASALCTRLEHRVGTAAALRAQLESALLEQGYPLADHETVSEYVREVVESELRNRRRKTTEVIELRRQLARLSSSAEKRATKEGDSGLTALTSEPTPVSTSMGPALRATRTRRLVFIVAGLLVAAGAGAAWIARAPAPRADAAAESSPDGLDAAPGKGNATGALLIDANAPIAELRIGDRNVAFAEPLTKVEFPWAKRSAPVQIIATSSDGRTHALTLGPGEHRASIVFSEKVAPAVTSDSVKPPGDVDLSGKPTGTAKPLGDSTATKANRSGPTAAPSPTATVKSPLVDGPGLADSPY